MRKSPHGGLDLARWQQARALFDELTDLPLDQQRARLARLASSDSSMAAEVQSLLAHDRVASDTIPHLVTEAAASVAFSGEDAALPDRIGRYRVLSRLGAGGMGEVFLGEDPTLGRRVALKRPASLLAFDPAARARVLREARAAATLTHPHACVVHEVGEDDEGRPFLAMEYLEGETLAARIARGPVPLGELLRLGIQAAGALDAAHSHGVVHRDIKPSNLMLTAHGVKLLDFGLASLTRDQPDLEDGLLGTLPYMSPEQLERAPVDERSDLFSLGVALYEASTGRRPFEGGTPKQIREAILSAVPPAPSTIGSDLPAGFDAVVLRLLEKDPAKRFTRAADVVDALRALETPTRRHGRLVLLAVLLAAASGAVVWWVTPAVPPAPAERLTIVVGEFTAMPGDEGTAAALREALVVQLQQTPFLTVFPRTRVRETLKLMGHPPDATLTARLAREVAIRRGVPAWVAGSVTASAAGHRIVLTAARSQTGELLARETVDVSARSDLVVGLGRAAFHLRARLGESRASREQFSTPVEQATTGSLDAMKAYALGLQQGNAGEYALAASLFQRAVQIDPDFAMAWLALAREELNSSYSGQSIDAAARAYALRARVSDQEQARIEVFYHSSVSGDLERGVRAATEWQQTYPGEWWAYHTLADLHFTRGDYALAERAGRGAVRLNPDVAAGYSNLAGALFAQDRFAEARDVYQQAMGRGFDAPEYHAFLWRIAYYSGDEDGMRRQEDWAASSSTWAYNIPALAAALQGRWRHARTWSAQARALFTTRGQPGLVALADRYDALSGAVLGDCGPALGLSAPALATRPEEEQAQVALAWALCGRVAEAQQLEHALEASRPDDTRIQRIWLPSIRAATALSQGRPADAIEALRAATLPEGAGDSWPLFLRAAARLRVGDARGAAGDHATIVAHRGRTFWWPLVPLSHLGRARAAAMAGDSATARAAYDDFFAVWRHADADLPVVVAARREQASLRLDGGPSSTGR